MKKKIRINHTLKKQCNMIIGTVSVYKENVCKKMFEKPANLPVLSRHGV